MIMTQARKRLPIVSAPTLVATLPVSGIKIKYRPFVIKEQKALLLAQESKDPEVVLETIKSVIESCTSGTLEFTKVPTADLAYFFLQLRIASVGPEVKFSLACEACDEPNIINMSLNDITIDTNNIKQEIKITPTVGIKFRIPTIDDAIQSGDTQSVKVLYTLIDYIYDEETVYRKEDYTEEEFHEWIDNLNENQVSAIREFVDSIPTLKHTLKFNCSNCNHEQSRQLEGLHNFFRFGFNS